MIITVCVISHVVKVKRVRVARRQYLLDPLSTSYSVLTLLHQETDRYFFFLPQIHVSECNKALNELSRRKEEPCTDPEAEPAKYEPDARVTVSVKECDSGCSLDSWQVDTVECPHYHL